MCDDPALLEEAKAKNRSSSTVNRFSDEVLRCAPVLAVVLRRNELVPLSCVICNYTEIAVRKAYADR